MPQVIGRGNHIVCISRNMRKIKAFNNSLPLSVCADNVYRKCLANGTWALKGNYSMCKAILHEEVSVFVCACKHETFINQKTQQQSEG